MLIMILLTTLPDLLDINGASPVRVKSGENPVELVLRSVQVAHIVRLDFAFSGYMAGLSIYRLEFVFPGWIFFFFSVGSSVYMLGSVFPGWTYRYGLHLYF